MASPRYHVPILVRALRVLEYLSERSEGCGITELAGRLQLPKNTAFRILTTLTDHGYLVRDGEGRTYRLGRQLLSLGYAAIDETSLIEKSMDVLRDLRDTTGETAMIAVLLGDVGVVLENAPSHHPVKVTVQVGHRFPLHTAAPGKALLAFLPEVEREQLIQKLTLTRYNEKTITGTQALREELAHVRQAGYALDRGEEIDGIHCVGAPVLNHRGYPLAGIWVGGLSTSLKASQFEALGQQVRDAAHQISRRFGYELKQVG